MGNRNAAGRRGGGATKRLRTALKRGKVKRTMAKFTGKKPVSTSYRIWKMTHKGKKYR